MADDNSPSQQESRPPEKAAGSSGFRLLHREGQAGFDPITQRVMVAASMRAMSGPLPMASEFALYEKSLPGAGDRILTIGEKEQDGRLAENQWRLRLDEMLVKGHNLRAGLAQPMAFTLVLVSLYISNSLIMHNHDAAGIALGTTTIGAILAAFLGARYIQPKDEKKDADNQLPQ